MESLIVSTGLVALAEIGDKTQLLAFVLAAKYRRPAPILLGILVATLFNHGFAAGVGVWLASLLGPEVLRWLLGVSFLVMAVWVLVPDEPGEAEPGYAPIGVFGTTLVAFFLAEMGDKTQIATVALAAEYQTLAPVVAGTTLGMLLANAPAVYLGDCSTRRIPMGVIRGAAAAIFVLFAFAALLGVGRGLGL